MTVTAPELIFSGIYFVLVFASTLSKYRELEIYRKLKPLPVLGLFLILLYHAAFSESGVQTEKARYYLVMGGLLSGLVGDILLLNRKYFKLGLLAFLTGHVLYITAFYAPGWGKKIFFIVIAFAASSLYFRIFSRAFLKKNPDKMRRLYLIGFYILVLSILFIISANFSINYGKAIGRWVIAGAFFFSISDGMLAWQYFINENKIKKIFISAFYYSAQATFAASAFYLFG